MKNNETFKAVLRFVITGILMANAILTAKGMNPIPFDEGAFAECVTYLASGVSAVWVWWKNNNVTRAAKEAQGYKKALQEDGDGSDSLEEEV